MNETAAFRGVLPEITDLNKMIDWIDSVDEQNCLQTNIQSYLIYKSNLTLFFDLFHQRFFSISHRLFQNLKVRLDFFEDSLNGTEQAL